MLLGRGVQGLHLGVRGFDSEIVRTKGRVHPQFSQRPNPQVIKVLGGRELADELVREFVEHPGDVKLETLSVQRVAAAAVNHLPLAVHHVVVLQQALPDAEVVLLDLSLGALNGLRDHRMLDDLSFLVAHPVHHLGDALTLEEAHQSRLRGRRRTGCCPGLPGGPNGRATGGPPAGCHGVPCR